MKTKIADDVINGSHQEQFIWCKEHGLTNKPQINSTVTDIQTVECGKFGGICSSIKCREEHKKLV